MQLLCLRVLKSKYYWQEELRVLAQVCDARPGSNLHCMSGKILVQVLRSLCESEAVVELDGGKIK